MITGLILCWICDKHIEFLLIAFTLQVYCPHTAVDAAPGGLGDWLQDVITRDEM